MNLCRNPLSEIQLHTVLEFRLFFTFDIPVLLETILVAVKLVSC